MSYFGVGAELGLGGPGGMDEGGGAVEDLEKLSFEQAFGELEATVQRLEGGNLTLDEAIALYERGMDLARRCSDTLDAAELRVQQVAVPSNQQPVT